jgi:hypothetical protein
LSTASTFYRVGLFAIKAKADPLDSREMMASLEAVMVLTKSELIASLQHEVQILLHLAGKIDRSKLDYRPTPKQRSIIELLKYLSMMGPTIIEYAKAVTPDPNLWADAAKEAEARDFDQTVAAIAAQKEVYATVLGAMSDADFRAEVNDFTGGKTSRGALIVNLVLCGCAAYRTQLFVYLKACGREELGTMNLWAGVDAPAAPVGA